VAAAFISATFTIPFPLPTSFIMAAKKRKRRHGISRRYTFRALMKGYTFTVPADQHSSIRSAVWYYNKKWPSKHIITRKEVDGSITVERIK
jgi:hypothetical protein